MVASNKLDSVIENRILRDKSPEAKAGRRRALIRAVYGEQLPFELILNFCIRSWFFCLRRGVYVYPNVLHADILRDWQRSPVQLDQRGNHTSRCIRVGISSHLDFLRILIHFRCVSTYFVVSLQLFDTESTVTLPLMQVHSSTPQFHSLCG